METQEEILNTETGTKEIEKLKPEKVKIEKVEIVEVGEKKNKKLVCNVKHPAREETIAISSVKFEKNKKLQEVGLWINFDEDKKLRKGSSVAVLFEKAGVKKALELEGKELETTEDERGYLCFKAY